MILKPSHVPLAKIVGARQPPGPVAPVEDGEIALQLAAFRQHRSELCPSRLRQAASKEFIEPCRCVLARDLVPGEGGDIENSDTTADLSALLAYEVKGIGPP